MKLLYSCLHSCLRSLKKWNFYILDYILGYVHYISFFLLLLLLLTIIIIYTKQEWTNLINYIYKWWLIVFIKIIFITSFKTYNYKNNTLIFGLYIRIIYCWHSITHTHTVKNTLFVCIFKHTLQGWDHMVCMLDCICRYFVYVELVYGYLKKTTWLIFQTKINFLELTKVLGHMVGKVVSEVW